MHKMPLIACQVKFMGTFNRVVFPDVSGSNLNGDQKDFPRDFKAKLSVVVVAFKRNQVSLLESWVPALSRLEQEEPEVKFFEFPVLSASYGPFRWWINGGMGAGIVDEAARQRTVTVYLDKGKFKKQLGITTEATIYLFLVNRDGSILWQTNGAFSQEKLTRLQKALQDNLLPQPEAYT
jgi:hypothetical protein